VRGLITWKSVVRLFLASIIPAEILRTLDRAGRLYGRKIYTA
jgi:hypothetical protein